MADEESNLYVLTRISIMYLLYHCDHWATNQSNPVDYPCLLSTCQAPAAAAFITPPGSPAVGWKGQAPLAAMAHTVFPRL